MSDITPQIDFYITQQTAQGRLQFACQKIAEAYSAKQTIYIQCATAKEMALLDDLLWTFNDISFIPHGNKESNTPVQLGHDVWPDKPFHLLINLHPDVPPQPQHYQQIIEIVCTDPELKNISRAHYKAYQTANFPLKSHNLDK